jgi:hypothetical protein
MGRERTMSCMSGSKKEGKKDRSKEEKNIKKRRIE